MEKEIKANISHIRAEIAPNTYNKEAGTFDVVFATERANRTFHWDIGDYNEILSCDAMNVRMQRAETGLPVFDSHYPRKAMMQLGVAENIRFENNQAIATIRLGARADEALRSDIENGVIKGISAGYNVYAYKQEGEITPNTREIPTYKATDWEPTEISFAPVQADPNAKIRSQETDSHTVLITKTTIEMSEKTAEVVESTREEKTPKTPVATPTTEVVDVAKVRQEATDAQKQRLDAILKSTRAAKLEDTRAIEFFNSEDSIEAIRQQVIDEFVKAQPAKPKGEVDVTTGKEGIEKKREAAEQAVLNRIDPKAFTLDKVEGAREFRGLAVHEIAKEFILERGGNVRMLSKDDLAKMIFEGKRDMATGDFPLLLENVANKALRGDYQYAPEFWNKIARETSVSDFKEKSLYQVGSSNGMKEIPEGGEIEYGKLEEARQRISVKSFGEGLRFTRKAFINDDLSAFSLIPSKFVLDWNTTQGDLVWAMITGNIVMADNKALFHADHKNLLSGAGSALADAGLTAALKAYRAQTALDGVRKIRVTPKYLIVSTDLEVTARKLLYMGVNPSQPSEVNLWAGAYELIVEPRLSGNSWYLTADPNAIDGLYYAYLNGNAGLRSNRVDNFKTDSIDFAVRGEFGVQAVDYRGWQKNVGS